MVYNWDIRRQENILLKIFVVFSLAIIKRVPKILK
jgi:hypothetical protein